MKWKVSKELYLFSMLTISFPSIIKISPRIVFFPYYCESLLNVRVRFPPLIYIFLMDYTSVSQAHGLIVAQVSGNLVFQVPLFQVCLLPSSVGFLLVPDPIIRSVKLISGLSVVSSRKRRVEVVITAVTCCAFIFLLLGGSFLHRFHKVRKLNDEVFVDVEGSFSIFACF